MWVDEEGMESIGRVLTELHKDWEYAVDDGAKTKSKTMDFGSWIY